MRHAFSLRLRLTAIILLPLLIIAGLIGVWQLNNARLTATEVFDRSLLSAALAVANDVAISEGDALSASTRDILNGTSGGPVFYHVYAPDGVIVAGYATPPVGIVRVEAEAARPNYFEATYLGRPVSGVRFQTRAEIDGRAGVFTTTVWQDTAARTRFVRDLMLRTFITIAALIASLALIVWFGVRLGLRPLLDLENAIAQRSSTDLSPIRRAVPPEVSGVVQTLNRLFGQVSTTMRAQSEFIGNAAHQLRNPLAGVLSLAEAVQTAPDEGAAKRRARDLFDAAREASDLGQKLLMLERAEALVPQSSFDDLDLNAELANWVAAGRQITRDTVEITAHPLSAPAQITGDATMLQEAVVNLIDNALRHAGPDMTRIAVRVQRIGDEIALSVEDDGHGLPIADIPRALERFTQISETSSSGLGLSIVKAIALGHGGRLEVSTDEGGLRVALHLPVNAAG